LTFRIKDKMVLLEAGLTQAERNAIVPGKQHTTGQLIVCNPAIATCQRALGLDPRTDLTFFANPQGTYTLLDIFCGDFDSWADTVTNVYVGKGSDFFMCSSTCSTFITPGNNIPATYVCAGCLYSYCDLTSWFGTRCVTRGCINTFNFQLVNNCLVCCCTGTAYFYCTTTCSYASGHGGVQPNSSTQMYTLCCFPDTSYITIS